MSKQFINFGSAWYSKNKEGIISCNINPEKNGGIVLYAKDPNGQELPISSFFMKANKKEKETHPDYQMTFVIED